MKTNFFLIIWIALENSLPALTCSRIVFTSLTGKFNKQLINRCETYHSFSYILIFHNSVKSTVARSFAKRKLHRWFSSFPSFAISFFRFTSTLRDIFRQIVLLRGQTTMFRRYLYTLRFRCLHRRALVCPSIPQINGSWAISRIVAVLFSRFRSIRRDATLPSCTYRLASEAISCAAKRHFRRDLWCRVSLIPANR